MTLRFVWGIFFLLLVSLCLKIFIWTPLPISESVLFYAEAQNATWILHNNWHPPLYLWIFHLFFRVFGVSPQTSYFVNLVGFITLLGITFKLINVLVSEAKQRWLVKAWFCLIYLSLPVVYQGIFLLDIDTSILPAIFAWAFLSYLNYIEQPKSKWAVSFFASLFFLGWAKLAYLVLFLIGIGINELREKRLKTIICFLIPTALLTLGSYLFYAKLFIPDQSGTIAFNLGRLTALFFPIEIIKNAIKNFGVNLVWAGPFLLLLIKPVVSVSREPKLRRVVVISSVFVVLMLGLEVLMRFPKHMYSMYFVLALVLAVFFAKEEFDFWDVGVVGSAVIGSIVFFQDPLRIICRYGVFQESIYGALIYIGILLIIFFSLWWIRKSFLRAALLVHFIWVFSVLVWQLSATYSTNYWYGTSGYVEAIRYTKKLAQAGHSYYFRYGGYWVYNQNLAHKPGKNSIEWLGGIPGRPMLAYDYFVIEYTSLKNGRFGVTSTDLAQNNFVFNKKIGDFFVFEKKN